MAAHSHAQGTGTLAAETKVNVRISPVIEREFRRRGIFPELRLDNATRIQNGATGIYSISVGLAGDLLADAEAMWYDHRGDLPRGIPAAYSALARNVKQVLQVEARRGIWDDPGWEEACKRVADASACFKVGDKALYFGDGDEYGTHATIVGGYQMRAVTGAGPYVAADGERRSYRPGYAIECKNERFFCPAHAITRDDCRPSHLQLVHGAHQGA